MTIFYALFDKGFPSKLYDDATFPPSADGSRNPGIDAGALVIDQATYSKIAAAFVAPPLVPETISDRQFMQQLVIQGKISWVEATAYVSTGTIPNIFAQAFAMLPPDKQAEVAFTFIGAKSFDRHNEITLMVGPILGFSPANLDALWAAASKLP